MTHHAAPFSSSETCRLLSAGFAVFSMFFGAGNIVFPLALGQQTGAEGGWALLGLLLTGVCVPILGLITIILFNGDYLRFFSQCGKQSGLFLMGLILLFMGPFGALPRCIALTHCTLNLSFPHFLPFWLFSGCACGLIFLFTFRQHQLLALLGKYLTPFLLLMLSLIVGIGWWMGEAPVSSSHSPAQAFVMGLQKGYHTMDLLASFFFSAVVYQTLKAQQSEGSSSLFSLSIKAGLVGGTLLSLVYIGFTYVATQHAQALEGIAPGELLSVLSARILGPYAALVSGVAIALACLTTAMALAAIFAEFMQKIVSKQRLTYIQSLGITIGLSYGVSLLEFTTLITLLSPVLEVIYPFLILFTAVNLILEWRRQQSVQRAEADRINPYSMQKRSELLRELP